jgi:hypothetical protein
MPGIGSPGAAARARAPQPAGTTGKIHAVDKVVTSAERVNDVLCPRSLTLPAPIVKRDNGIPLGNGLTGGPFSGESNTLKLSLDRGDLWDERGNADANSPRRTFATLLKSYHGRNRKTWDRLLNSTYGRGHWTKMPGGRLVVTLPADKQIVSFRLDFGKATGGVAFADGTEAAVFFSATEPMAMLRLPGGLRSSWCARPRSTSRRSSPTSPIRRASACAPARHPAGRQRPPAMIRSRAFRPPP